MFPPRAPSSASRTGHRFLASRADEPSSRRDGPLTDRHQRLRARSPRRARRL